MNKYALVCQLIDTEIIPKYLDCYNIYTKELITYVFSANIIVVPVQPLLPDPINNKTSYGFDCFGNVRKNIKDYCAIEIDQEIGDLFIGLKAL